MKNIPTRQLLVTLVVAVAVLAVFAALRVFLKIPSPIMMLDPAAIGGIHPLAGCLSNLGVILWCVTASVCGFVAGTIRRVTPRGPFWFLLASALLSAYLLFDDFFQMHDEVFPKYLGVDENVVLAVLAVAVVVYLVAFRRQILLSGPLLLIVALAFFALSVAVDTFLGSPVERLGLGVLFFEDGAKWMGLACWCSYYVATSHKLLVAALGRPGEGSSPTSVVAGS